MYGILLNLPDQTLAQILPVLPYQVTKGLETGHSHAESLIFGGFYNHGQPRANNVDLKTFSFSLRFFFMKSSSF